MKIPAPRKLSSGKWFIQLRLGGESITVSNYDKSACIREARAIKAAHQAGKRLPAKEPEAPTLTQAIDAYINAKSNTLSPATIRGYRVLQRNRLKLTMPRRIDQIGDNEWQAIFNQEALLCGPKTLKNAYFLVRSAVSFSTGRKIPDVTLPAVAPAVRPFLAPDEIRTFVQAIKDTKVAVPALLALSSLRSSEIRALRWENIPPNPEFIQVAGAVVEDEFGIGTFKQQNKNATSTRKVPILIPELSAAIERDRQPIGPVLQLTPNKFRDNINRACAANGLPEVGIHGLRHSFASLAYHLQIPEKIAMEIGGWADSTTMHRIYTHIAQSDFERYKKALGSFYDPPEPDDSVSKTS